MEHLIIIFYFLFIVHELRRSQKSLWESKSKICEGIALGITVTFVLYLASELISFFQNKNGKSFTVGWYALEYFLVTSFAVYTFLCWCLAMFSRINTHEERLEDPIIYNIGHVIFLAVGSVVGCYLTIQVNLLLFPPYDKISFHVIFWSAIYFLFFCVVMIGMNWEMQITGWILLRILFICTVAPQIIGRAVIIVGDFFFIQNAR